MKTPISFIAFFLFCFQTSFCQTLQIDSTRFFAGVNPHVLIGKIIPTTDNGIFITGEATQNAGGIIPASPYAGTNVMVGKLDSNRQIKWIKVYGGNGDDGAISACQTADGGYAVVGETASNDGDVSGYHGNGDIWVLRLDSSGSLMWEKCFGSSQSDGAISIANTADSGLIILATTNGSDGDIPFHYGSTWTFDWLVIKTDKNGSVQWKKVVGGTGDEANYGAILSASDNYYIVSYSSSRDYDCSDTAWHPGENTYDDIHLLNLNDTGKVMWDSSYGGSRDDVAYDAMYDTRDSTVEVIGMTESSDHMVTANHGGEDIWVLKVDKNGVMLWQRSLGCKQDEEGTGITASKNGGYIAYGRTYPGLVFDTSIEHIGGTDCWLFMLDALGNETGNKIFGGTDQEKTGNIISSLTGYAATGLSGSATFSEGVTYGNFGGGGPFISYIDSVTLDVKSVTTNNQTLMLYPNPTADNINLLLPSENGIVRVFDNIGRVIYQTLELTTARTQIDTHDWLNGLYMIVWQGKNGNMATARLMKE